MLIGFHRCLYHYISNQYQTPQARATQNAAGSRTGSPWHFFGCRIETWWVRRGCLRASSHAVSSCQTFTAAPLPTCNQLARKWFRYVSMCFDVSTCSIAFDVSFVVKITSHWIIFEVCFEKTQGSATPEWEPEDCKTHRNLGYCGTQYWNNQAGKCDKYNETCGDRWFEFRI